MCRITWHNLGVIRDSCVCIVTTKAGIIWLNKFYFADKIILCFCWLYFFVLLSNVIYWWGPFFFFLEWATVSPNNANRLGNMPGCCSSKDRAFKVLRLVKYSVYSLLKLGAANLLVWFPSGLLYLACFYMGIAYTLRGYDVWLNTQM
jgi:hypothetical protein